MEIKLVKYYNHYESALWRDHIPDSKVHGANMGSIWGRQDPGGPHVGPMNFAIRDLTGGFTVKLEITQMLGSTSIRHQSDTFMSDWCLIDADRKVFAIWEEVSREESSPMGSHHNVFSTPHTMCLTAMNYYIQSSPVTTWSNIALYCIRHGSDKYRR